MAVPLQELRDVQDAGPGAQAALRIRDVPSSRKGSGLLVCFALSTPEMPLQVSPRTSDFHSSSAMFKLNLP